MKSANGLGFKTKPDMKKKNGMTISSAGEAQTWP